MTPRAVVKRLGLVAAALAAAGCATPKPRPIVEWPPPPDKARIRFISAFRAGEDLDQSSSSLVLRAIVGGGRDVMVQRPMGLAVSADGEKLYIADFGDPRVLVADFKKRSLSVFAPTDVVGTPFGLALDGAGNLYCTDQGGRRVVVLRPDGTLLRAFGKDEELVRPSGIAVDSRNKRVYVADPARIDSPDHRVLTYDLEGNLIRVHGEGRGNAPGQFNFPVFVAVDDAGRLFVADSMNFRVQIFEPDGTFVRAFGENGNTPGTFARMKGLAFDGFGNLYVVEGEDAVVQMFNADFQPLMFFGGAVNALEFMSLPVPIAIDPKRNRIYIGNQVNPRINVYDLINTTADDAATGRASLRKR